MNYPKDNNNLIVNYMNNLWEKAKKLTKELHLISGKKIKKLLNNMLLELRLLKEIMLRTFYRMF